jgi:L-seryl-tRNA(Ser) seleniumtransferase
VHAVLEALGPVNLPRPVVLDLIRRHLTALRSNVLQRETNEPVTLPKVAAQIRTALDSFGRTRIQPVINATGVTVHTNLGRAPLSEGACRAMQDVAGNFCNLEYDLDAGERGRRGGYVERTLSILCGAEAALVVNNCAAALVLILHHFASKKPRRNVIISRGELVQIGGGFRVPDILRAGGARLREVGTTNQTTLDDYQSAIDDRTAMILRVHRSNFYMDGFVSSRSTTELAAVAHAAKLPANGNRPPRRRSAPARTWSVSAAINCWAAHRPASSSGRPTTFAN